MSVAGQARHIPTSMMLIGGANDELGILHALIRDIQNKPAGASSRPIGSVNSNPSISNTNIFTNPIAFHPEAFAIVSDEPDTLRIDENFGKFSPRVIVLGEAAAADNVEFIIGVDDGQGNSAKAAYAGQLLNIQAVLTTPITLIEGADISLPGAANFTIPGGQNATLIFDSTSDKWKLINVGATSAAWSLTPAVSDINFNLFDGINIDRLRFVEDSGVPLVCSDTTILKRTGGDFQFNVPTGSDFAFTVNCLDAFVVDDSFARFINPNGVYVLDIRNEDTGIIDLDQIGEIRFTGDDQTTGGFQPTTYGRILVNADDVNPTSSLDSRMSFFSVFQGVSEAWCNVNTLGNNEIHFDKILDMGNNEIHDVAGIFPEDDGLDDIGTPSLSFNNLNIDSVRFRHNTTIDSTVGMIGLTSASMQFNVISGNEHSFLIAGNQEYSMDSLAMKFKNLNFLMFLDNVDNQDVKINYQDPAFLIDLSGSAQAMIIENSFALPSFILRGQNTADALLAHSILFQGLSSSSVIREYGNIRVRQTDTANTAEFGEMEFHLIENGVPDVTYMQLNALFEEAQFFVDIALGTNATQISMGERFINFNDMLDSAVPTPSATNRRIYYSSDEDAMVAKDSSGTVHNLEVSAGGGGGGGGGGALGTGGLFAKITKTVDESRSTDTTQTNDSELFFEAEANKSYFVQLNLFWSSGVSGLDTDWSLPTGATGRVSEQNNAFSSQDAQSTIDVGTDDFHGQGANLRTNNFLVRITMGSTAGTVNFRWAQNSSQASPVTIEAGSTMLVYEEGTGTSAGVGIGDSKIYAKIVKTADETVTSSAVVQADDELKVPLKANTAYHITLLFYFQTNVAADFKYNFSVPSGATGNQLSGLWNATNLDDAEAFGTERNVEPNDTVVHHIQQHLRVITGSTSGDFIFQWAQRISDAGDTKVLRGSMMEVLEEGTEVGQNSLEQFVYSKTVKGIDQTVNNSATLVDDSEIFFSGKANTDYQFDLLIYFESTSTADLKTAFSLPSGASGDVNIADWTSLDSSGTQDITSSDDHNGGSGVRAVELHGRILMGSTPGLVRFRWAQVTATVEDTKVLRGSKLTVYQEGTQTIDTTTGFPSYVETVYEERTTQTATNKLQADPEFLAKWEIIPPAGLSEFNSIIMNSGRLQAYIRRASGTGNATIGTTSSDDDVTYSQEVTATNTTGSFTQEDASIEHDNIASSRRFVAIALWGTISPAVHEAREIKIGGQLWVPAGYRVVRLI